ncbi:MAG: hypothetical protein KDB03_07065 [Planctomycetales bacterium]|nr:hypothetical protein [Planctomycetales bacterium]
MKVRVFVATLAVVAAGYFTGCTPVRHNLPPAQQLLEPGPGVGGPGPGVMMMSDATAGGGAPVIPAGYACSDDGSGGMMVPGAMGGTAQLLFGRPDGMEIHYDVIGDGSFGSDALFVPGRLEFGMGGIYRLKLTNIQSREGVELYPTIEVAGPNPRTAAYLAHNAIPVHFNPDDIEQVLSGNFVTKVIYLPDPEFQGDALVGVDVLVSNRLNPGVDPIVEADRRGAILAIIRLGNKDIELSGMSGAGAMAGMPTIYEGAGGPTLPGYVSGMTGPEYGMPYSGTPIGLVGPPHIPYGSPAGLQKHVMRNRTSTHIPDPVSNVKINVRQSPGLSYPQPASRVRIHEQSFNTGASANMPLMMHQNQAVGAEYCPE